MAVHFERVCTCCGRPESVVGTVSTRGRCEECARLIMLANTEQMRERCGPFYEHWLEQTERGVAAARGAFEEGRRPGES